MKKNIVLLFITAFLLNGINSHAEAPSPRLSNIGQEQQNKTSTKQEKSKRDQQIPNNVSATINIDPTHSPDLEKENSSKHSNNEGADNWSDSNVLLVIFNGLLAIFTFCLWKSTNKMWGATKEAANAAKKSADSLQAIERAYLFIDYMKWNPWKQPFTKAEYNQSKVKIGIINTGRTPAVNYEIGVEVVIKKGAIEKGDYPTKEDARKATKISLPSTIIIKSQEVEPVSCFERIGPSVITEADFSKCTILCYGFVRYDDIFDEHREMFFCYQFIPSQTHERFHVSLDTELNCYTQCH